MCLTVVGGLVSLVDMKTSLGRDLPMAFAGGVQALEKTIGGEVAVLEECNWALMHPAPKRARHGEYLGDDFLPLNFLTHG